MISIIVIGYTITLLGAVLAYLLSKGKSKRKKIMTLGILLMIPISEALAFSLGVTVTYIMQDVGYKL